MFAGVWVRVKFLKPVLYGAVFFMLGPERVFSKTWTRFSFSFIYNSYKKLLDYIVHKLFNNKKIRATLPSFLLMLLNVSILCRVCSHIMLKMSLILREKQLFSLKSLWIDKKYDLEVVNVINHHFSWKWVIFNRISTFPFSAAITPVVQC